MQCPACQHEETRVVDSRESRDSVRRRRECISCSHRFTTFERAEIRMPMVVKRDGRREPFDRDKLGEGIRLACRKRPISEEAIDAAVGRVEQHLARRAEREVSTHEIGKVALEELRGMDPVAYIRFASVYQALGSPQDFMEVLRPLLEDP
ncbi:MAG TPA: transcriptional regulator NrdR [Myxococcota bacterium]|nr:transcriptional regulator NrdR [Myxococcota bacterium]HND28588.1 transcriptional regulator NrdR [Myxococcota bacterium]HNH47137.1 transcriptional regulator NrdR [Myxococcota bacterium]